MGQEMDALNEAFNKAEEELRNLGLGVPASVKMMSGAILHFKKTGGEWGLFITLSEGGEEIAVRSTSREARILAAQKLTELHESLIRNSEMQLHSVREARVSVERFVEDLKNRKL